MKKLKIRFVTFPLSKYSGIFQTNLKLKAMKKIFMLVLFPCYLFSQCPIKGDNKNPKMEHLDSLKNRNIEGLNPETIDVSVFLCPVCNKDSLNSNKFVSVTGYLVGYKYGGSETCNCHSKNKADLDYHIEIASSPEEKDKKKMMVCEVTRFTKTFDLDKLKMFLHEKVIVTGWLFSDEEHKQNSVDQTPNGTNLWRATAWEVHPAFNIVLE